MSDKSAKTPETAPSKSQGAPAPREQQTQTEAAASGRRVNLERVLDVRVELSVQLGRRRLPIAEVVALTPGSVVEFTKPADEALDIFVNEQLIARGEAVVVGERYGVRITEIVSPNERLNRSGLIAEEASS